MGGGFAASALQRRAISSSRLLRHFVHTTRFRPSIRQIISSLLQLLALLATASGAAAQTAQLIVTGPPALAGSYAAVTYDQAPGNVTWTTPIAQGDFFIYDGVNCATHTLTKPVAGSGAGKVALLTGSYPATCAYYDDIVGELQADGVVAVVFGFTAGAWRTRMLHERPAGLTVPVLDMQVDEVSQSIRSAVLGGATVSAAFVAVPGMALIEDQDSIVDSTGRCNGLVKSLCRGLVVQSLPRTLVNSPGDRVELGLRVR